MEIQKGIAATLRFPEPDGDAVSLSEPTVTVVRDSDGSILVNKEDAKSQEKGAYFTYDLKGSEIPEVDLLRVTWADADSTIEQLVEVVGGFACSIASVKKKLDEPAEGLPTDEEIALQRVRATRDIEVACWDAFRHRYAKETLSGNNRSELVLSSRRVRKILSLSVDGNVFTESEIKELSITLIGVDRNRWEWPGGWTRGTDNIIIAYIYGHDNYPSAANPVRDLTADYLTEFPTNWEGRAMSYTDTEGNNYRMVTSGEKGARFSVPSVNAFVQNHEGFRLL